MNIMSAVIILIVLFYVVLGFKRGVIKTGVSLVGTVAILVVSFVLKDIVANFLMDKLPFFNFGGVFDGITSINILMYEMISFIVVFVVLYCFLNILLTLSGLIEKILKLTIVLAIPSKILGALLGLVEGVIVAFLVSFVFLHLAPTESYVMDSKLAIIVLERTPFIGKMTTSTTLALEDINNIVNSLKEDDNRSEANYKVLHQMIYWKVISVDQAQKLINDKKIEFDNEIELNGD